MNIASSGADDEHVQKPKSFKAGLAEAAEAGLLDLQISNFSAWLKNNDAPRPQRPLAPARPFSGGPIPAYVAAAINDECEQLAAMAPNSGRNGKLNEATFNLAGFVNGGHVSREYLEGALTDAARRSGLLDGEIEKTLKSGFDGSAKKVGARDIPERADEPDGTTITLEELASGAETPESAARIMANGARILGITRDIIDNAAAAQTPVLADLLINRSGLRNLPKPEPLIDGTLDRGTTALLYGKWGSYKSFLALDWAASIATGHGWLGRPTEQQRALYVAAEGAFGYASRVDAWESSWKTPIADDALDLYPRPINLTRASEVDQLCALIVWGGFGFIVLDTLARCMVGADENSAKDAGIVIDALNRIREATPDGRGVALGVHHSGKDGRTLRGSSAFEGGVDTTYFVEADGTGRILLERQKRKDGPVDDRHSLRFAPIPGSGSGVLECLTGGETASRDEKLLSHMVSHFAATGATATQLLDTAEMTRATFYRALNSLVGRGDLVNAGTTARPFYQLASNTAVSPEGR